MRRFLVLLLALLVVGLAVLLLRGPAENIAAMFGPDILVARATSDIAPLDTMNSGNVEIVSIAGKDLKPGMISDASGASRDEFRKSFADLVPRREIKKGSIVVFADLADSRESMNKVDYIVLRQRQAAGTVISADMLDTRSRNRATLPVDALVLPRGETLDRLLGRLETKMLVRDVPQSMPLAFSMLAVVQGEYAGDGEPLVEEEDYTKLSRAVFEHRLNSTTNAVRFELAEVRDAVLSGKDTVDIYFGVAGFGADAGIETWRHAASDVVLRSYYGALETPQVAAEDREDAGVVYYAFVDSELANAIAVRRSISAPILLAPAGMPLAASKGESAICSGLVCYRTVPPSIAYEAADVSAALCEIKGHASEDNRKLYYMPGTTAYAATPADFWFCSEEEARAKGFAKAS